MNKAAKLQKLLIEAKSFRDDLEKREKDGEEISQEDRNKLSAMIDDGLRLREEIKAEMDLDDLDVFANQPNGERQTKSGAQIQKEDHRSWGNIVIQSKQYESAHNAGQRVMDRVSVKADLHSLTDSAGGYLLTAQRDPMVGLPQRPVSILELITISQTASNSVEYARHSARTNNAAPMLEYDVTGGDFNLKPQSELEFELDTASVKTIPTYVAASRNILADAPQLRGLIDDELTYMVRVELEDQVLNGDGTGANFTGILQTAGIQTRTQASTSDRGGEATDTKADAIRRAITDIQLAFYEVSGVLLNPGDAEDLELIKTSEGDYVNVFDPVAMRLWRVPVVESPIITAGTALVGNYRMGATMWDRQQTEIRVGEPGNFFLQNAVAVLAELRAAFAVKRPTAFEKITFA